MVANAATSAFASYKVAMVANAATSVFASISPTSVSSVNRASPKPAANIGGLPASVDVRGIRLKSISSKPLQVKANAQSPTYQNSTSVQDGLAFRQNISVRSYEIGADQTVSVETLINYFQDTSVNHLKHIGLLGDGLGSTPEMCKKNLIWVATAMQAIFDGYPTWGDVVQVDTQLAASGRNCIRCDWLLRDYNTGHILTRASSYFVLMNNKTRRLTKLTNEVRAELGCHLVHTPPIVKENIRKLQKLKDRDADYIKTGLTPRWTDFDVNQHVNNVKYIRLILESTPQLVESHELASMSLEYTKECTKDSVLDSLTSVLGKEKGDLASCGKVECQHLLRHEDGVEVLKGRTIWRPKRVCTNASCGQLQQKIAYLAKHF